MKLDRLEICFFVSPYLLNWIPSTIQFAMVLFVKIYSKKIIKGYILQTFSNLNYKTITIIVF